MTSSNETIAGYRSNRSSLLIMLTELTFCHKSSTNISIENQYQNRFIQLGRPIFPVKCNGAALFTIPITFGIAHARVTLARHRSPNLRPESDHRYSTARCFFCQPITSSIIIFTSGPTCLLVQAQLQSILWPWKTESIGCQPCATSNPAISSWLLWLPVIAQWL